MLWSMTLTASREGGKANNSNFITAPALGPEHLFFFLDAENE